MPTTDTTEAGLETLIVHHITGSDGLLTDCTQVYKQFVENEAFRRQVTDLVYAITHAA